MTPIYSYIVREDKQIYINYNDIINILNKDKLKYKDLLKLIKINKSDLK